MGRIVVGVDGSEHSVRALRWAAAEARVHRHVLEPVTASPPEVLPEASWVTPHPPSDVLVALKHVQTEALEQAHTADLTVLEHREVGFPTESLLRHAEGADLLVVGSRGFGRFRGALLGSVGHQVVTHAPCPVTVVPQHAPTIRRILVGVDGSEQSRHALGWAHAEAQAHGAELEAVSVYRWSAGSVGAPWLPLAVLPDDRQARQRTADVLDATVDEVIGSDATVQRTVLDGEPAGALLAAAHRADLLVVGSRGLGGFERLLLGSVSARVVVHAPCPVTVIPIG